LTLVPNYVPTDWVNGTTPVDDTRMDKLDQATDAHADAINALDTRLIAEEAQPDIPTVVNGSWIKGSGGAMVWSTIAIADVTNLQTSLNAKQDTSAKGAVNGYAGLDSTGKVPTTQLPTPTDLRWAGTYAGATAYKEGDVVIYNGISYMALRASTGETPVPWGSGAGGGGTGWDAVASVTAQQDSTSTSAVDIPGLTAALLANTVYEFEAVLEIQSSSGAGMRLGVNFSAAGAAAEHYWGGAQTASAANQAVGVALGTTPTQAWAAVATTPVVVWGKGIIRVGANAGNLTVQQQKVTSGTASVFTGSSLKTRKVSP
jgi:hypothetical protein